MIITIEAEGGSAGGYFTDNEVLLPEGQAEVSIKTKPLTSPMIQTFTATGHDGFNEYAGAANHKCATIKDDDGLTTNQDMIAVWEVVDIESIEKASPLSNNEHHKEGYPYTASLGAGQRIFPGKQHPDDEVARDEVYARATISPALGSTFRGHDVNVPFRPYDVVDPDPRKEVNPVPDGQGGVMKNPAPDNRGSSGGGGGSAQVNAMGEGADKATRLFRVSKQPGDNFRIAACCDGPQFDFLEPDEAKADEDPDKMYLPPGAAQVAGFNGRITPTLWVWRRLHVEIDDMEAVGDANYLDGNVIGMEHVKDANNEPLGHRIDTDIVINDGSLGLGYSDPTTFPPFRGRFENGYMTIGTESFPPGSIYGSGEQDGRVFLYRKEEDTFDIPFLATKEGEDPWPGYIVGLEQGARPGESRFQADAQIPFPDYGGGNLRVAGEDFTIVESDVQGWGYWVEGDAATLPITDLHDDDDDDLLPAGGIGHIKDALTDALHEAYIVPDFDLLQQNNTNDTMSFGLNLSGQDVVDERDWDTVLMNAPDFWVTHLQLAYQPQTTRDRDPDAGESALLGVTPSTSGGAIMYRETIRDGTTDTAWNFATGEGYTGAHEFGHAVSGSGEEPVIGASIDPATQDYADLTRPGRYVARYLKHLRNTFKPISDQSPEP